MRHCEQKCSPTGWEPVVTCLTKIIHLNNVKSMSRFIFAAAVSLVVSRAAVAQRVPGRDLLEFPLGTLAESPPLTRLIVGGIWNPASAVLPARERAQVGFAALTTPYEQGVESKMIAAAFRLRPSLSGAASFVQSSVSDVFKTESDPQSFGDAIPYGTQVLSFGLGGRLVLLLGRLAVEWAAMTSSPTELFGRCVPCQV